MISSGSVLFSKAFGVLIVVLVPHGDMVVVRGGVGMRTLLAWPLALALVANLQLTCMAADPFRNGVNQAWVDYGTFLRP